MGGLPPATFGAVRTCSAEAANAAQSLSTEAPGRWMEQRLISTFGGLTLNLRRRVMENAMKAFIIAILIACVAAPAEAMPIGMPNLPVHEDITTVQSRGRDAGVRGSSRTVRSSRGPSRGVSHRHVRGPARGHVRGHSRHHHRYYRHSRNNSGAVAAGLIGGMLIGGMAASAVAQQNQSAWSNHVNWCSQRFRSFRVSDNSWQPNNGPRRQCISPF